MNKHNLLIFFKFPFSRSFFSQYQWIITVRLHHVNTYIYIYTPPASTLALLSVSLIFPPMVDIDPPRDTEQTPAAEAAHSTLPVTVSFHTCCFQTPFTVTNRQSTRGLMCAVPLVTARCCESMRHTKNEGRSCVYTRKCVRRARRSCERLRVSAFSSGSCLRRRDFLEEEHCRVSRTEVIVLEYSNSHLPIKC